MADNSDNAVDLAGEGRAVPAHVVIVMDGNGRWAERRGLPRHAGHRAGVASVRAVIEESIRSGVSALTLFAFSSENWRRPRSEVSLLMELFVSALEREVRRLEANDIRLTVIGDVAPFPEKLKRRIREAEARTADKARFRLQIAANYGGRWDIVQAARRLAERAAAGTIAAADIDETAFAGELATTGLPEPDLFIRTGGEQRISNFLLWQCAYTEFYFCDTLWPDFDAAAYRAALADFGRRQRRFGHTGAQLEKPVKSRA
ncbi:MAG: polyprenyl diphosphate synthase [Gammaproteobacteria bacterium]